MAKRNSVLKPFRTSFYPLEIPKLLIKSINKVKSEELIYFILFSWWNAFIEASSHHIHIWHKHHVWWHEGSTTLTRLTSVRVWGNSTFNSNEHSFLRVAKSFTLSVSSHHLRIEVQTSHSSWHAIWHLVGESSKHGILRIVNKFDPKFVMYTFFIIAVLAYSSLGIISMRKSKISVLAIH